jgi:hypothetical protein
LPKNASSKQKFQIIADVIHFDYANKLLWKTKKFYAKLGL